MAEGTIAAGSPGAAEAGAEVLAAGGNATDAALAAMLVAFHVEPLLASAAGGGVMLAGDPTQGYDVMEFVPVMPGRGLAARPDLDFVDVSIDFEFTHQVFHVGRGAAAVPMGLLGIHAAHERWGRIPLRDVVAPAVRVCRDGFEVSEAPASFIRILEPIWRMTPEAAALFTVGGRRAAVGDRLTNPDFASVLELLATEGIEPFTTGDVAHAILDAFGPAHGGLITADDLALARPTTRTPLRIDLLGGSLLTPPPNSTGGALIAFGLALLERAGAAAPLDTAAHASHMIDVQLAMLAALRDVRDGDEPAPEAARRLLAPTTIDAYAARLGTFPPGGGVDPPGHGSTTHVSVIDRDGGAASITMSNGEGCGSVIPGTGMSMNNFLGEEDINPRGFHVLPAGATMTTMMSPTLFLRDGRPELVLGSGGANRLRTAILQVAWARLGLGLSLDEAVGASRIHVEEEALFAELPGLDAAEIERRGAGFARRDPFPRRTLYFGGVHAVGRDAGGRLVGAGDPRRGGAVATR